MQPLFVLCCPDISGDVVISKLKRLPKTSNVKIVLYACDTADKQHVTDNTRPKVGVKNVLLINSETELVDALDSL